MFLKNWRSYDDEKLLVNVYLMIWLLTGFSTLPAVCTAALNDYVQHSLTMQEIENFAFHMAPSFLKMKRSRFVENMTIHFMKKMVSHDTAKVITSKLWLNVTIDSTA